MRGKNKKNKTKEEKRKNTEAIKEKTKDRRNSIMENE